MTDSEAPEQTDTPNEELLEHPIGHEVELFVRRIESLAKSLPLLLAVTYLTERKAQEEFGRFLETYGERSDDDPERFNIGTDQYHAFKPLEKRLHTAKAAREIVPRSFLISLVSQFDAYLGSIIRALFYLKPEVLNASEKNLSFAQLLEFESLDEAREFIIEKEVESVLRDSHAAHFRWLEAKFGLPLTRDLPVWATFIEVTERRNLFVHTGGYVSRQYLKVCREHGVKFGQAPFGPEPRLGEEISMSAAYFRRSYRSIYEVGVKLAHVLWRKLLPSELGQADSNLITICFDLLADEDYELAKTMLDFATTTIKRHSSEDLRRRLVINRAQAYKWSGDEKKANEIVDTEDWSASSEDFRLAVAVLRDDFATAAEIMKRIGPSGSLQRGDYRDWPLFKRFRETTEFLVAHEEVFGEEFARVVLKEDANSVSVPEFDYEEVDILLPERRQAIPARAGDAVASSGPDSPEPHA